MESKEEEEDDQEMEGKEKDYEEMESKEEVESQAQYSQEPALDLQPTLDPDSFDEWVLPWLVFLSEHIPNSPEY